MSTWYCSLSSCGIPRLRRADTPTRRPQNTRHHPSEGVDSVGLAPILGDGVIIGGTTHVVATLAEPGIIRHTGMMVKIRCGRLDGRHDAVLASYVEEIKNLNIDVTLADHILPISGGNFVLLSANSGMIASTRQPLGVIREDADMRAFFYQLMEETMAVGHAAARLSRLQLPWPASEAPGVDTEHEAIPRLGPS
jgi:ketopantoate reductase